MRTQTHSGFTIIEVMLFLAITGALTVGILVGSGVAIGQQRYRDSVNSFKGLIQEQYGQIANVVNSEVQKDACTQVGNTLDFNDTTLQPRGTSECLIMGRFLLVEPTKTTAYNVIGRPMTAATGGSDTEVLQNYALSTIMPEVQDVAWNATIVEPKTTNGLTAAILIIRSPLSGAILTYVESDTSDLANIIDTSEGNHTLAVMVSDGNMAQKDFCIDSGGRSAMANRLAVRINARAANQSAIGIPLEEDNICD